MSHCGLGEEKVACEVHLHGEYVAAIGMCGICWCIAIISCERVIGTKIM